MGHRPVICRLRRRGLPAACILLGALFLPARAAAREDIPLPGTAPLEIAGDAASDLVAGVDRFLLRAIECSVLERDRLWLEGPERSKEARRRSLTRILGARDERTAPGALELIATTERSAVVGRGEGYDVLAVRWPAFRNVHGEGLLARPRGREPVADVLAIPDADQTPEMLLGLTEGVPPESQFARRLAEAGCRVLTPVLIDRKEVRHGISRRELVYRSAFVLGRHIVGYEVQKVLAAVDWLTAEGGPGDGRVGVLGWGEGGLLALHVAAIDPRVAAVCVSGYFEPREGVWKEPLYRNVFGLLEEFGDAELGTLIAPRILIVEAARGPEVRVQPGTRAAPGRLRTPPLPEVRREVERARRLGGSASADSLHLVVSGEDGGGPCGSPVAIQTLLAALGVRHELPDPGPPPEPLVRLIDPERRQERQLSELLDHGQWLLGESPYVRREFFAKLDTSSLRRFEATVEWYRQYFRDRVVGHFDQEMLPARPRTRKIFQRPGYTGYEVVLDVFPDVAAFGILLLPEGWEDGGRRPAVVCQHGLEGRPRDLADPRVNNPHYEQFGCRLAERGFVVFAPQNLYLFGDRFRTLQRKANPLGKTLFSVMVPQHRRITQWLGSLECVDAERIGFYGLSYGGKTAMRVPPLVDAYCLSICSADFNDWVWKNASTRSTYSYVWTGEYEIFEFDLGSTFNYAEMAAMIAPRPFMVERGHFDGVAPDETVAYEFAKVRHLYAARLGIGDRLEIEWFPGPHKIHGKGTFEFLHKHLRWPRERP